MCNTGVKGSLGPMSSALSSPGVRGGGDVQALSHLQCESGLCVPSSQPSFRDSAIVLLVCCSVGSGTYKTAFNYFPSY